jgi:hypothetical protein
MAPGEDETALFTFGILLVLLKIAFRAFHLMLVPSGFPVFSVRLRVFIFSSFHLPGLKSNLVKIDFTARFARRRGRKVAFLLFSAERPENNKTPISSREKRDVFCAEMNIRYLLRSS